jgi:hypothetical protein
MTGCVGDHGQISLRSYDIVLLYVATAVPHTNATSDNATPAVLS